MNRCWWFNPDNDLALAANVSNFTPPSAAIKLRHAGEILPLFIASDGDAVFCSGINAKWLENLQSIFNLKANVWNHDCSGLIPQPWGWSKAARNFFVKQGFAQHTLPTDSLLEQWRELSHRRTASEVSRYLAGNDILNIWEPAIEISSVEQLHHYINSNTTIVIKQPWSSSGRGISFLNPENFSKDTLLRQLAATIQRYGSVMIEKFMPGHKDFALLFECKDKSASFIGSSIPLSSKGANYIGNIVAKESFLKNAISSFLPQGICETLISALTHALTDIYAKNYDGPLGVDICTYGNAIHICEINLRYTMGFIAKGISDHLNDDIPRLLHYTTFDKINSNDISLSQPGASSSHTFALSINIEPLI